MKKIIIKVISSIFFEVKYFLINFFSRKRLKVDLNANLHISLTTYHKRLSKVYLTIETLFCQTVSPSSITLWLAAEDIDSCLPNSIKRLKTRGLRVHILDENIYSYKKLYYAYLLLSKNMHAKIVTVDDDVFYPKFMLYELSKHHALTGGVVCFRGHYISFDNDYNLLPYKKWSSELNQSTKEEYLLPTGVGGVLYPIQSLRGLEIQKNDFISISPTADDIWFKFLSLDNGFKSYRVSDLNFHPLPLLSFNMKGLERENVYEGRNDEQIAKVITYFTFKY